MPPCEYFTLFYIQCGVYTEFGIEPFLHRSCRAEIPVKDILSNLADLAFVGMILFLWALSCQPHSMHKPLYPLMIDLVAALYQFLIYSSHTVAAFML